MDLFVGRVKVVRSFVRIGRGVSRRWFVGCGVRWWGWFVMWGITVGWCIGWGVSVGCSVVVMRCCVFIFIVIIEERCSSGHGSRGDCSQC